MFSRRACRFHVPVKETLASIILLFVWTTSIVAQTNLGGISGTITDQNGAVVPNASVTVVNVSTNRTLTLTTSEDGIYNAAQLEPAFYRIIVEAPNFKRAITENVKVDTAITTTTNITLEAGLSTEEITVTAEASIINTESGTGGQTITERQIVDLPLGNRNVLDLALTVPNVVAPEGNIGSEDPVITTGIPSPGANISINGGRQGSSAILADGVNNTGVSLSRAAVTFSPDVVQEITVQTSAYSAEYGQSGGGIINATTKSGGNRFSGTLYAYNRNPVFAADPFSTATVNRPFANRRQNQFGAIFGGPVFLPRFGEGGPAFYDGRDRTFFFVAYEPRWYSDGFNIDALLPTEAMRRGDFSNLVAINNSGNSAAPASIVNQLVSSGRLNANQVGAPLTIYQQFNQAPGTNQFNQRLNNTTTGQATFAQFPNNVIPTAMLDPTAQRLLQFLPPAGEYFVNGNGQLRNYGGVRFVKNREQRLLTRFDHQISGANQLNFRYTQVPIFGFRGRGEFIENAIIGDYSASKQVLLGDTHIFSPTVINNLKINYTRGIYTRTNPPEYQSRNFSTDFGLPSLTAAGLPAFRLGPFAIGQEGVNDISDNIEENFNISDTLSVVRGNQTIKIGTDLRHQRYKVIKFGTAAGGNYEFDGSLTNSTRAASGAIGGLNFATFLLGVPSNVGLRNGVVPYYYRWNAGAIFVQDDWKVRQNLTLNLGLRYQLQLPRTEKYDRQATFLLDKSITVPLTTDQRLLRRTNGTPFTITGPDGTTQISVLAPASMTVPAYAFAGQGERSRYLHPIDKNDFEPRFGFAYTPKWFGLNGDGERALVLRGGYGISHLVITTLGRDPAPDFATTGGETFNFERGAANPLYATRLSSNAPLLIGRSTEQILLVPAGGVVSYDPANPRLNSLNYRGQTQGFAVDPDFKVPYIQNWNLTAQYELLRNTVLEVSYAGSKGTHLFNPPINLNPRPFAVNETLTGIGFNTDETIRDPLGRQDIGGGVIGVPLGSLFSPFAGFDRISFQLQPAVNSIRHAGYASIVRRFTGGLAFTANYTFAKSIDEASDQGIIPGSISGSRSQVSFGGSRQAERAVSSFDIKHSFSATFNYELPFGRGRALLGDAPGIVNALLGGYQLTGIVRVLGGFPFTPTLRDTNRLVSPTGELQARADLVAGVPVRNPLWRRDCPISQACEPYFNPAAFQRPPKGQLGNAPRSFDDARTPRREFFDLGIQKNFRFGEDGRRYLQLRAEAINVLNHPTFLTNPNDPQGLFNNLPSEGLISQTEYNQFVQLNPGKASVSLNTINQQLTRSYLPGTQVLPANFFSVPLPEGFATRAQNSFDITTLDGLKLYRLRQQYNQNFGTLGARNEDSRQLQFMIKFYF